MIISFGNLSGISAHAAVVVFAELVRWSDYCSIAKVVAVTQIVNKMLIRLSPAATISSTKEIQLLGINCQSHFLLIKSFNFDLAAFLF